MQEEMLEEILNDQEIHYGKNVINLDSQGWPVFKLSLRDILICLGLREEKGKLCIDKNDPILDQYPVVVVDDGMGYGIDENYIIEVNADINCEKPIVMFREVDTFSKTNEKKNA
jgi:hypothetical protein